MELVSRGFELVTRRFELVTCRVELVSRGFELVTRGLEFVTLFYFNFFLLFHYPLNYRNMGKFTLYYLKSKYKTSTNKKKKKIEKTMGIN